MPHYLAIDAGGTKAQLLLADEQQKILAETVVGTASLTAVDHEVALANLKQGIEQLTDELNRQAIPLNLQSIVMGIAGLDTPEDEQLAQQIFSELFTPLCPTPALILNDAWIALENVSQKPNAIVLVAGTGSNCLGRNAQGKKVKVGGLDYLLADEGSSYAVGYQLLHMVTKSLDGRAQETALAPALFAYFHVQNLGQLKKEIYHPPLTKRQIADLAKLCDQTAPVDDQLTLQILDQAAADLVAMAAAAIHQLDLAQTDFDLVFSGGLNKQAYLQKQLFTQLAAKYPQINLLIPTQAPVYGALRLAYQAK